MSQVFIAYTSRRLRAATTTSVLIPLLFRMYSAWSSYYSQQQLSNPEPQLIVLDIIHAILRTTLSRLVYVGIRPRSRTRGQFLLLNEMFIKYLRIFYYDCPLWHHDISLIRNCSWASPAQSNSSPRSAGLMTRCYCLKFQILPIWRARFPYLFHSVAR
jgi:hypothetical protein